MFTSREANVVALIIMSLVLSLCSCTTPEKEQATVAGQELIAEYGDMFKNKIDDLFPGWTGVKSMEPYIETRNQLYSTTAEYICTGMIEMTISINGKEIRLIYDTEKDKLYSDELKRTIITGLYEILERDANICNCDIVTEIRETTEDEELFYKEGFLPVGDATFANVEKLLVLVFAETYNEKLELQGEFDEFVKGLYESNDIMLTLGVVSIQPGEIENGDLRKKYFEVWDYYLKTCLERLKDGENSLADKNSMIDTELVKEIILYVNAQGNSCEVFNVTK